MTKPSFALTLIGALLLSGAAFAQANGDGGRGGGGGGVGGAGGGSDPESHLHLLARPVVAAAVPGRPNRSPRSRGRDGSVSRDIDCRNYQERGVAFSDGQIAPGACPNP